MAESADDFFNIPKSYGLRGSSSAELIVRTRAVIRPSSGSGL